MAEDTASSQDSKQPTDPVELDQAALDEAAGGAARYQTAKPTKKGGSVYADPCMGGE